MGMFKKTILCLIAISIVLVSGASSSKKTRPARWTLPLQWRRNLAEGLSYSAVLKALGEPKYIRIRSAATSTLDVFWYYQKKPYSIKLSEKELANHRAKHLTFLEKRVIYNDGGYVQFQNHKIKHWVEPVWDELKGLVIPEKKRDKPLKPSKKTPKWQIKRNWSKLNFGFSRSVAVKFIGQPVYLKKYSSGFEWHYGKTDRHGILRFNKYGELDLIIHPFWIDVEKEVKEQVDAEKQKKLINSAKTGG